MALCLGFSYVSLHVLITNEDKDVSIYFFSVDTVILKQFGYINANRVVS